MAKGGEKTSLNLKPTGAGHGGAVCNLTLGRQRQETGKFKMNFIARPCLKKPIKTT
jgi:hypothetical protein